MDSILVSIIIPTFNRAHFLKETLNSVKLQTYSNWECIIVDDGSSDNTQDLLDEFCALDPRIKFFHRPINRPKGANACRNFGFEKSRGQYIQWFDSDDLMVKDHLEQKVNVLEGTQVDFVISKTANFDALQEYPPYEYTKMPYGIKVEDFIFRRVHWYTYDVMLRRKIASLIKYHENMISWQDYYYFCCMLLESTNGLYIDRVLTKRRLHGNSIQDEMTKDYVSLQTQILEAKFYTFSDIKNRLSPSIQREMLFTLMNHSFNLASEKKISRYNKNISKELKMHLGYKSVVLFNFACLTSFLTGKGFFLLQLAKKK